jgi:hypothetical protein
VGLWGGLWAVGAFAGVPSFFARSLARVRFSIFYKFYVFV